ncbi:kinase-like protein [Teratosphaeria nubilosa]|uniref:non-specific serine/threonine protein kinase n=1 Tax=Teratosphaeria nubilosa TaxID=161662 RepID=A0A6G1L071_9PEZI|nr:kinase-like protein [Teratosphaeria nubilosa]
MATQRQPASSSRRPANLDQEPDEVIGDFRRGKEIGKGSFATVYMAQHRKKKSLAAVKAVQMAKLTKKLKENLETEISILKSLQHPHIVALFACIETPMYIYLVMEYCQLSDLAQFMKKRHHLAELHETEGIFKRYPNPPSGGLHEVLSRHFLKQIASALQYLRSRNLIHRDIKPQNLLLNPAPAAMAQLDPEKVPLAASEHSLVPSVGVDTLPMLKVADFGFARHLPSTSMAETLCGSPLYMAPEILRYEKYDARADLWSTGTVLHEMVVGKPPFRASNHVELLRRIEKANDQIIFDNKTMTISRGMKDVIRKLLKKSPLDRISYEDFFQDPVVTGEIPGLLSEDKPQAIYKPTPEPRVSELSRRMAKQAIDAPAQSRATPPMDVTAKRPKEEVSLAPHPDNQYARHAEEPVRRKSSANHPEGIPIQRQSSQRDMYEQRRPSIVAHATAPAREGLHAVQVAPASLPRVERRASRSSPLAGPPMVREPSVAAENQSSKDARARREARESTAHDIAFEKEYVVVEKRAVEVNAFADELEANANGRGLHGQMAMTRRATTQGQPTSTTGAQPASPSRAAMQMVAGRAPTMHQRAGSFERRYAPSPQSATNMLTKALNAANVRLFGALGTSPPFGKGPSPPRGYTAFPAYPAPQAALLLGDGGDAKTPMDEDMKIVRTIEEAAHRSDVIFGFAEVKYKQLLPATPSTADALGIQQIGAQSEPSDGTEEDKDMTTAAIVGVAEEALVLYVKALAILAKTIDLAGYWWQKRNRVETVTSDPSSRPNSATSEVSKRMNSIVQWTRDRFNECLEKSEVVGRQLQSAQRQLPPDHPSHQSNIGAGSTGVSGAIMTSAEQIQLTSGVTAERLMFERAVEMSRAAAVSELVNEELSDCELGYVTAIMLLEAVLEADDEPLMRRPSSKKDKPADEIINGMETEDRQTVLKLVEGARSRLQALRRKIHAAQAQMAKRPVKSGNATPKPTSSPSPATMTPALAGVSPAR